MVWRTPLDVGRGFADLHAVFQTRRFCLAFSYGETLCGKLRLTGEGIRVFL